MATWPELRRHQLERVHELGFRDLTNFGEEHWGDTRIELAARLDSTVRPSDLMQWMRAEAVAWRLVPRYLRGALLRNLNKKLSRGWGPGDDSAARTALAVWSAQFGDWADQPVLRVFRYLADRHPPNWKPRDPDDPILVAAFEAADFPYEKVTSPFPIEPRISVPGDTEGDR